MFNWRYFNPYLLTIKQRIQSMTKFCIFFIILFLFNSSAFSSVYEVTVTSDSEISDVLTLRGEVLCGSTPNRWIVEFPNDVTDETIRRIFPSYRFLGQEIDLLGADPSENDEIDTYRTWSNIPTELSQLASLYPNLMTHDTIGLSVQNRPVFYVKISDSVHIDRDVPTLYIVGGTHGNELISVETVMNFIQWILPQSQNDTTIQRLLRQCELHIVPVLNPDGYAVHQRQNANMVDLNRNFTYFWGRNAVQIGTSPLSEPETNALDSLLQVIQPTIGVSYHSFGQLILRPYSGAVRPSANHPICQNISNLYWNFLQGYTQMFGWQLYLHGGEHNDHCVSQFSFPSITIEVWSGPNYNPPVDSIQSVTSPHRNALVQLIHRLTQGQVTGIVRDLQTGLPITNATYQVVEQLDSSYALQRVHSTTGRFRSLQVASTITMRFQAEGYVTRTVSFTIPSNQTPVEQDVYLTTSASFLSVSANLYSNQLVDSVFVRIQNYEMMIPSNIPIVLSNLIAQIDTVWIGDSVTTEQFILTIQLVSSETTYVNLPIAELLPPVGMQGYWAMGNAVLQWSPPYINLPARLRIRGYQIWRDSLLLIPWQIDTIFAEPMTENFPRTYRVKTLYWSGISSFGDSVTIEIPNDAKHQMPKDFEITSPYPNPFNSSTQFLIQTTTSTNVELLIYNVLGQLVYRKEELLHAGIHSVRWTPSDYYHTSGIYIVRILTMYGEKNFKLIYLR